MSEREGRSRKAHALVVRYLRGCQAVGIPDPTSDEALALVEQWGDVEWAVMVQGLRNELGQRVHLPSEETRREVVERLRQLGRFSTDRAEKAARAARQVVHEEANEEAAVEAVPQRDLRGAGRARQGARRGVGVPRGGHHARARSRG